MKQDAAQTAAAILGKPLAVGPAEGSDLEVDDSFEGEESAEEATLDSLADDFVSAATSGDKQAVKAVFRTLLDLARG